MTPEEQALSEQLFGGQQQGKGATEVVKEALKEFRDEMYPGLTWDKISSDLGKELNQQVAHGAHELAAALFNGSAFVMYPRSSGKDDHGNQGPEPAQEPAQDTQNTQQETPGLHMERGGRSR
jgi:hypothetical protein